MTEKIKKERGTTPRKLPLICAAVGVVLLLVLSYLLIEHPDLFLPAPKDDVPKTMYSDKLVSYNFYPTDYELNVEENEHYMGLDRYLHIKRGAETFAVTDGNYAKFGDTAVFFGEYFDAAIHGDVERYNSLFTEEYYKTNKPYEMFAPQMIYGITVEELSYTASETGDRYLYDVTYAIYRNDGTFRNDIDSDAFKTLIFELVTVNGEIKINKIDYYRKLS